MLTLSVLLLLACVALLFYAIAYVVYAEFRTVRVIFRSLFRSISRNPLIRRWTLRHPETVAFIGRRFSRSAFSGLTLTVLSIAFLYAAILLAGIVEDFLERDFVVTVDRFIATAMPHVRTPVLTSVFTTITLLGKAEVAVLFFAIVAFLLWLHHRKIYIVPFLVTVAGSTLFIALSKLAFHRPRPETAMYIESSYAFPSGHATLAVALYGFAAFLLIRFSASARFRFNVFYATLILAALIGFSRLYLCEHFLSDVYSGYLLGSLWLIIGIALSYRYESSERKTDMYPPWNKRRIATAAVLFLIAFGIYSHWFEYQKAILP